MPAERIVIAGGGAAGFFAAIACAQANPENDVRIYERASHFLTKVRISGGGRCNVTHTPSEPRTFSTRYPRGERALISALQRFSAEETIAWFEARGVQLKAESDGRMFPVTDASATVIDCLMAEAKAAGVQLIARNAVEAAEPCEGGGFVVRLTNGEFLPCDRLLLATGGARDVAGAVIARDLGHTIEPPVPSLFSLHVVTPWLRELPGVSANDVELAIVGTPLRQRGPLLITHNGVSGPAVLRLSAWGARVLAEMDYTFALRVNWLPERREQELTAELQARRTTEPNRLVRNSPFPSLPARLWEQLVRAVGIADDTRWTTLTRPHAQALAGLLTRCELPVNGKSLNKDEFVTCGGVSLRDVNFKTMESRIAPQLYFAGELLDIDGLTGGFNFQAAWTTGWIAGRAMAGVDANAS